MDVSLQGINPKLRHKLLTNTTTEQRGGVVGMGVQQLLDAVQVEVTGTDVYGNTTTSVVMVGAGGLSGHELVGEVVEVHQEEDHNDVEMLMEQEVVGEGEVEHQQQDEQQLMQEEIDFDTKGHIILDQKPSIVTVTAADLLEPTFPCPHCPRMFNRRNMVTRHINEIHKVALPYKCDLCDKTFSVIPSLQKHLMNYHDVDPEPYKCDDCKDTFTLQKLLEEHPCPSRHVKIIPLKRLTKTKVKAVPPPKKPKPVYTCKVCHRDFRTKSTLKRHITSHFKCGYCRKSVSSADNLVKHLRTHECDVEEDEKDFVCGQCEKRYYIEENFEVHRVWHKEEGIKKWGCSGCDQRWKSEDRYQGHLERCEGKVWECEICSQIFQRKGAWERHKGKGCTSTSQGQQIVDGGEVNATTDHPVEEKEMQSLSEEVMGDETQVEEVVGTTEEVQ